MPPVRLEHAIPAPAPVRLSPAQARPSAHASSRASFSMLSLLGVLSVYWCYVALSNVLYASSMQATFAQENAFAPWQPRMLQHLLLYPCLIGAVWGSLRVGWAPRWRALPVQLLICFGFAVLARPALVLGEGIYGQ
jgi:hypothetical protein